MPDPYHGESPGTPVTREETALRRDLTASSRDLAAEARDLAAGPGEQALLVADISPESTIRALRAASGRGRDLATADRGHAASDRQRAADDRAQASAERQQARIDLQQARIDLQQARIDLQRAQLDSLTGVYMRELGHVALQREIERSRRSGEPFALAFIDVDGLKELNDREGHAAGDELLQAVVAALKAQLRSYDPIVRLGGDEFLCGFTNTTLDAAQRRIGQTRVAIEHGPDAASISVGVASLDAGDTLDALIEKADLDMYANKQSRRSDG